MKRRDFLKIAAVAGVGSQLPLIGSAKAGSTAHQKVVILGIDGMDPHLSTEYMRQGLLPNVAKLARRGGINRVSSSIPPQSPVAWSNFITGGTPALHGIYDFIHRDPKTLSPYLSTSKVIPPEKTWRVGDWIIPLEKGETENLRQGKPFWDYLADREIPTTVFKVPANFPCESDRVDMVSGMGTPDLRGGYGNYTVFTTAPEKYPGDLNGGRIVPVSFNGSRHVEASLSGPANTMHPGSPESVVPLSIWRDSNNPVARLLIQDRELILKQGEWTDWIQLSFPMVGSVVTTSGICKLYLKSVHPEFILYVSPINIDPADPALPVVTSKKYGEDLVRHVGYFYTQGFPEDTKALSEGILNEDEYLNLAHQIIDERQRLLDYELKRFNRNPGGLLFFYFSSLDQDTHMYWRTIDPKHPLYDPELHKKYGNTLKELYGEIDKTVGKVLDEADMDDPSTTVMVMSDHGFAPFRRQVNLNTWLLESGYLALNDSKHVENEGYLANVNWSRTGAYNVGINSVYLNITGREGAGIVEPGEAKSLSEAIREELLELTDPKTGEKAISKIRIVPEAEHQRHPHAPDLIVGWNRGYRTSWGSILGGFSDEIFADNLDKWSGDHCIDPDLVPAVLFSNKKAARSNLNLCDLTATLLNEFQIEANDDMDGRPIFQS